MTRLSGNRTIFSSALSPSFRSARIIKEDSRPMKEAGAMVPCRSAALREVWHIRTQERAAASPFCAGLLTGARQVGQLSSLAGGVS